MCRLTEKDDQGNWSLKGVKWEQLHEGATITEELWQKLYGALWKLMEYEDTGLDPDDVISLNDFNQCSTEMVMKKLVKERAKHRWILTGERLPEDDTFVLVQITGTADHEKFNNAIQLGSYYPADGWLIDGHFDFVGEVAAWQPLPEPYKEDNHGEINA